MAPPCRRRVGLLIWAMLAAQSAAQVNLAALQVLAAAQAAQAHADIMPETQAVAPAGGDSSPASASPAAAATTASAKRNTRVQALIALRRARNWRPVLGNRSSSGSSSGSSSSGSGGGGGGGDFTPGAVCGANSLVPDNSVTNCRIVVTYSNGMVFTCSAFKMGDTLLGTAGHCIYQTPSGGWATAVDVYCTGASSCGVARTTYATRMTTTPRWMASETTKPTAWDGAVIRTASSLPGQAFLLGQYRAAGTYAVRMTGYPAQSGDPGCQSGAYANACRQYSTADTLQVWGGDMYTSGTLDLCSGHSGSGVYAADGSRFVTAVVSGASFSPCTNFFVPQMNSGSGVNADCEHPNGGVSYACLAKKV